MQEISLKTERKTQLIEITDLVRGRARRDERCHGGARLRPAHDGRRCDQRAHRSRARDRPRERVPARRRRRLGVDGTTTTTGRTRRRTLAPLSPRARRCSSRCVTGPCARHVPGRLLLRVRRAARAQDLRHDALRPMAAPVTKGEELELDVESLAFGGNGVARLDGFVVFVRRGLPGDRVRARVTKVKRSHAEALATEVLRPGPERVDAPCAHFPVVRRLPLPGSRLRGAARAEGDAGARRARQRLAGIAEPPLEPILPCEPEIFHYRNKLEYSFTATPEGPRSASTGPAAGTRCSRSRRCWLTDERRQRDPRRGPRAGRARRGSSRTRRPTAAATSATSSCGRAATRGRRSSSS